MYAAGCSLAAVLVIFSAGAAASPDTAGPHAEFAPFAGYRVGGEFRADGGEGGVAAATDTRDGGGWGASIGLYRDHESFYELLYSRRHAGLETPDPALQGLEVAIEYLHVGGTLLFPQPRGYIGYVSGTLGLTRLDARSGDYGTEHKFSVSLGGGVRFPLTERLAATFGLRGYMTFVDSDSVLVCTSADGEASCLLRASGRSFWEAEVTAGLSFAF
jgi:opacity protein-like surface antigen